MLKPGERAPASRNAASRTRLRRRIVPLIRLVCGLHAQAKLRQMESTYVATLPMSMRCHDGQPVEATKGQ